MTYSYTLPKCGHPRTWHTRKKLDAPRDYWFQICLADGEFELQKKTLTWAGVCGWGDRIIASRPDVEIVFAIDARVPESELAFPPVDAVWNRWQRKPFVEDGRQCVLVEVEGFRERVIA